MEETVSDQRTGSGRNFTNSILRSIFFGPTVCLGVLLSLGVASTASAQETGHGGHETGHAYHKNMVAGFFGFAFEGSRDEGVALGIEYERRLNATWGIGAIAEHTFGDFDTWVFAVPLAYHAGPWKFYGAPGIEDGEHGSESMFRLGVEYGFHRGNWEISPQLDIDFVDGEEILVIGLTFGRGL
jgi:hypothetical protein